MKGLQNVAVSAGSEPRVQTVIDRLAFIRSVLEDAHTNFNDAERCIDGRTPDGESGVNPGFESIEALLSQIANSAVHIRERSASLSRKLGD